MLSLIHISRQLNRTANDKTSAKIRFMWTIPLKSDNIKQQAARHRCLSLIHILMQSPDTCDDFGYANRRPALCETVKLMDWVFDSFSIQAALDTCLLYTSRCV